MLLPNHLILKDCEVSLTNVIINVALKCKIEEATKKMQFRLLKFTILVYFAAVHFYSKRWREKIIILVIFSKIISSFS